MSTQKVIFKIRKGHRKNTTKGKVFFTWTQIHTNGNKVNHQYNHIETAIEMLNSFISKIKTGDYIIE